MLGLRTDSIARADLVAAASLAVATLLVCVYFAPRGFEGGFVDMAHDGYQLRQALDLSQGGVIFRDTFDQYGPLNGYLNTVAFVAFGRRLLTIKYVIGFWYAAIAVALYAMARRWLTSALAAFSTGVWLALAPFYQHGIMISPHAYVLFFQTVAAIVVLGARHLEPQRFAVAGVLAGLSWGMKQSMGALFLVALVSFILLHGVLRQQSAAAVVKAMLAVSCAFFAVVATVVAFLWRAGALHDWYLQTVVFPQRFYIVTYPNLNAPDVSGRLLGIARRFAELQFAAPIYWLVIRSVVIGAGVVYAFRRELNAGFPLLALVTIFLWPGAFPSANFMHQWWTASLAIGPLVACVGALATRVTVRHRALVTAVAVALLVSPGVVQRAEAWRIRARTLTETITEPWVFSGVRTDVPTRRAFTTLYDAILTYRSHHPNTKIVSIDASDGLTTGIAQSLPFLSSFDGNTHSHPVYWSLPALSTTTYPDYLPALWRDVAANRPLIIDHRLGDYVPDEIAGYSILAGVQSEFGYWYLYAPDAPDREEHGETLAFLAADGSTILPARPQPQPQDVSEAVTPLNPSIYGGGRGRHAISFDAGPDAQPVDVYSWPVNLPLSRLPRAPNISPPAFPPVDRADIAVVVNRGQWTIDGQAEGRYSYLFRFPAQRIPAGALFIARGVVHEGGFSVGLQKNNEWLGVVNVNREGRFLLVMQVQTTDAYQLTVANCIESSWWAIARRHWLHGTLGWIVGGFAPNSIQVLNAGWTTESSLITATR